MDISILNEILKKSKSMSDVARNIFGKENYTNREKCKKILEEHGINWSEWLKEKSTKPKRYCLYCGKEIIEGDSRKKFCNHSCAASYNDKLYVKRKKSIRKCLFCGKYIERGKFCDNICHSKYKEKQYIERWKKGEETGLSGKYGVSRMVRNYIFETKENKCECCGKSYINPYTGLSVLQIHHIDGDCTNNREENLQLLCPTCHAMTENFGSRNKNATRKDNRKRY
jgi:predicted nucleic acid-binding Zn ribbon protein